MNYLYWERDSNPCHMLERHIAWTASRYPSICGESRSRTYISLLMTGSVQFPSLAEPLYRCRILIFITDILSLWLYITELLIYPPLASYANFAASPYISINFNHLVLILEFHVLLRTPLTNLPRKDKHSANNGQCYDGLYKLRKASFLIFVSILLKHNNKF